MNPQLHFFSSQDESLFMFNFNIYYFLTSFQGSPKSDAEWMLCSEIIAKYRTVIGISMEMKAFDDSPLPSLVSSVYL